jgi:tyrosine-protein kinase Etk/Wzc
MDSNNQQPIQNEEVDLKEILKTLRRGIPLIVLCTILGVTGAFLYLRYTTPIFEANATVKVDEEGGGIPNPFAEGLDLFGADKSILTQVEILKSRTLCEQTARDLGFETSYFIKGRLINSELYNNSPFSINYT